MAYFEGGQLVVDGYDIGKRVREYWGDSDYEYVIRIPPAGVLFLYREFGLEGSGEIELLNALRARFNTNTCYSDICRLLDANKIPYEGSTWV